MELSIGKKIYLNRNFVKKFEPDPKTSRGFQVIGITDVAVALKNLRNGRTYTLATGAVALNVEADPTTLVPKGRVVIRQETPTQPQEDNPPPPPPETNPPELFTHVAPVPSGGIKIKPTSAITSVEAGDDPFGGLYT